MSQNKTIAKNSLILYAKLIITSVLGLITTRYVLLYLGVSDFGLYSVVGSVVVMMNFFNTVMVSTTYRYIAFEMGRDDGRDVNKVFNISLSIHLAIAVLMVLLAESLGVWYIKNHLIVEAGRLADALTVFRLSILAAVFNIVCIPYKGFITAIEKFSVRAVIETLRAVLHLVLVIMLGLFMGDKLVIYALMMAGLTLLTSALFISYCKKNHACFVAWRLQKDKAKYKEMVAFSGWIMIGAAAHVGKDTGSQLIINAFFGTILNAAFGIAYRLNTFVKMFAQSLGQAAIPQITKSHSGGDHNRTRQLVAYISKYSFFLFFIPALPLLLETRFVLRLWLGEIPDYTVAFCRLMLINGLIDSLVAGIPAAVQASGRIKWFQIILSTIMLASLPISYWLFSTGLPPFSIIVVYISTSLVNLFISIYLLKRVINFDIKYLINTAYIRAFLVSISALPLFFIIAQFESSLLRFVIATACSVAWLLIMIYFLGLNRLEKATINGFVAEKRRLLLNK